MKILSLIFLFLTAVVCGFAQTTEPPHYVVIDSISTEYYNAIWYVIDGDTMAKATHSQIDIYADAGNRRKKNQYDKLQRKVIKVYPYAKAAGDVMGMYEAVCKQVTNPHEQERLLDQAEEEMKKQFEKDLRDMTISEGIILIKLIDRQTGNSSYKLVQDLKGKFSAFMWQSVARMFGHNLKDEYEAEGEDVWIENIVLQIEDGTIPVQTKQVDPFGLRAYSAHH